MEQDAFLAGVGVVARFIVGGAMLWAGIAKLRNQDQFALSIREFVPMVPSARWMAWTVPTAEIALGTLLVLGIFVRWAASAMLVLLAAFTLTLLRAVVQSRRTQCFCFGSGGHTVGWWAIHRNLGLILLTGVVAHSQTSTVGVDALIDRGSAWPQPFELVVVATAVTLAAIVIWLVIGEALRYRSRG